MISSLWWGSFFSFSQSYLFSDGFYYWMAQEILDLVQIAILSPPTSTPPNFATLSRSNYSSAALEAAIPWFSSS